MSLSDTEYAALRRTIASRGTARMVLFPITMLGWAALALVVLTFAEAPVASLYPLAVLVGGFEAIHALHVGVERIGRYLQVYYENTDMGPRWETTAMAVGPALPGAASTRSSTHLRQRHVCEYHPGARAAAASDLD